MTHAGIALMGAAICDQQLQEALLTRMRKLRPALEKSLFFGYGPLSSFSAKIDLAYALELLDDKSYKRLSIARKIRNTFAHTDEFLNFESPDVVELINKLPEDGGKTLENSKLYLWHLQQVEAHLVSVAGSTILKPSRTSASAGA